MSYQEVMDLILDYGSIKFDIGAAVANSEESADKEEQKDEVLSRICEVILSLTKEAGAKA